MPAFRLPSPVSMRITGTASAFPGPIVDPSGVEHDEVTNEAILENAFGPDWRGKLEAMGQDPDYAEKTVGLKKRRWTHWVGTPIDHEEVHTGDLAVEAAKKAMEAAGVGPEGIDLLILSTTSPLKVTSSTATHVAGRLDIMAPAIELKAGCSSGLYALITAAAYLRLGAGRILLVASETLSKFATPGVPQAMLNVGDGAGAMIIEGDASGKAALLSAMIDSDGKLGEIVSTPGLLPPTKEAVEAGRYFYAGDPRELKDAVSEKYPLVFKSIFTDAAMLPTSLDLYIPHQVNRLVTLGTAQGLGLPEEKVFVNLHEHGNLGSACFFVALHEALSSGRVKRGDVVGTAVVGGGLTWGGAILRL